MFEPEYYYDVLWYTDKKVTVAFSCAVDEVIQNPGRVMTFATIMINNKKLGRLLPVLVLLSVTRNG